MFADLGAAAFLLFFAAVYNHFGHGVHSAFLDLAFLWPLGGAAAHALAALRHAAPAPRADNALFAALTAFAVGSVLAGVHAIAGTSSAWLVWFFVAGGAALAVFAVELCRPRAARRSGAADLPGRAALGEPPL